MWKDFFYYTKSQRRAVCVLLTLIALLLMGIWLLPEAKKNQVVEASKTDSVIIISFICQHPPKSFLKESLPKNTPQGNSAHSTRATRALPQDLQAFEKA